MTGADIPLFFVAIIGGALALGVAIALIVVAVKVTGGLLSGLFWLIRHVVGFALGMLKDAIRFVGAVVASIVALPFATGNVILGRWPRAEYWGRALRREFLIAGYSIWSLVVRRPLRLLCLDGVLEGVETRLPQHDAAANEAGTRPSAEAFLRPGTAQFEGYEVEGTLRPGGSGAKLYVAVPSKEKRARFTGGPDKVVIKSFALEEGSSLPQIVRESRALDAARAMGLVLDHGLDQGRFWYAMPYHPGDNLNETTRFLHARSGSEGLQREDLRAAVGYLRDLVRTLARYHEGGLWHKDVKPDNIIVHDGKAHLVDLGLVTPLRSAMTLTTHGTEYFRDPEMVRQALRGVRVHQVDGAKFDVYGAGAVLYFLLENTFPAHGGLSSFTKRSPEALKWIVRRAMADYQQRYPSTQAMLADIEAVVASADPWTVRPVDLPSMQRADLDAADVAPAIGAAAWTPRPTASAPPPASASRPRLVVTNWWHGAYASPDVAARVKDARVAVEAGREAVRRKPRERTARREPPRLAAAIGIVLIAVAAIVATGNHFGAGGSSEPSELSTVEAVAKRSMPPTRFTAPVEGARFLVVNDHPTPANPMVQEAIDAVLAAYSDRGFTVVRDDSETAARASLAFAKLRTSMDPAEDDARADVEAAIATGGYFGILHVEAPSGDGSPIERLVVRVEGEQAKSYQAASKKKRKTRVSSSEPSVAFRLPLALPPATPPRPRIPPAADSQGPASNSGSASATAVGEVGPPRPSAP